MKNYILILLFTCFTFLLHGQELNEKQIIGQWYVINVFIVAKDTYNVPLNDKRFAPISEGFGNATFIFSDNTDFTLLTSKNSELFMMLTEILTNQKWIYDTTEQLIKIGSKSDNYSTMQIFPMIQNDKNYFYIEESGMMFEVVKKKD